MSTIRLAIAGVGNCASSLVQGLSYYRDASPDDDVPGLMHVDLGGYHVRDIEVIAAFDVDALVLELIAREPVIPVLVEAQRMCLEPTRARLLAESIERALPELSDQPAAVEALARLSGLLRPAVAAKRLGRRCNGRYWARN